MFTVLIVKRGTVHGSMGPYNRRADAVADAQGLADRIGAGAQVYVQRLQADRLDNPARRRCVTLEPTQRTEIEGQRFVLHSKHRKLEPAEKAAQELRAAGYPQVEVVTFEQGIGVYRRGRRKTPAAKKRERAEQPAAPAPIVVEAPVEPATIEQPEPERLSYDDWKNRMQEYLAQSFKYSPGQVGSSHFTEKMAELSDQYPEYEARFDSEQSPQPEPAPAPAPEPPPVQDEPIGALIKSGQIGYAIGKADALGLTELRRAIEEYSVRHDQYRRPQARIERAKQKGRTVRESDIQEMAAAEPALTAAWAKVTPLLPTDDPFYGVQPPPTEAPTDYEGPPPHIFQTTNKKGDPFWIVESSKKGYPFAPTRTDYEAIKARVKAAGGWTMRYSRSLRRPGGFAFRTLPEAEAWLTSEVPPGTDYTVTALDGLDEPGEQEAPPPTVAPSEAPPRPVAPSEAPPRPVAPSEARGALAPPPRAYSELPAELQRRLAAVVADVLAEYPVKAPSASIRKRWETMRPRPDWIDQIPTPPRRQNPVPTIRMMGLYNQVKAKIRQTDDRDLMWATLERPDLPDSPTEGLKNWVYRYIDQVSYQHFAPEGLPPRPARGTTYSKDEIGRLAMSLPVIFGPLVAARKYAEAANRRLGIFDTRTEGASQQRGDPWKMAVYRTLGGSFVQLYDDRLKDLSRAMRPGELYGAFYPRGGGTNEILPTPRKWTSHLVESFNRAFDGYYDTIRFLSDPSLYDNQRDPVELLAIFDQAGQRTAWEGFASAFYGLNTDHRISREERARLDRLTADDPAEVLALIRDGQLLATGSPAAQVLRPPGAGGGSAPVVDRADPFGGRSAAELERISGAERKQIALAILNVAFSEELLPGLTPKQRRALRELFGPRLLAEVGRREGMSPGGARALAAATSAGRISPANWIAYPGAGDKLADPGLTRPADIAAYIEENTPLRGVTVTNSPKDFSGYSTAISWAAPEGIEAWARRGGRKMLLSAGSLSKKTRKEAVKEAVTSGIIGAASELVRLYRTGFDLDALVQRYGATSAAEKRRIERATASEHSRAVSKLTVQVARQNNDRRIGFFRREARKLSDAIEARNPRNTRQLAEAVALVPGWRVADNHKYAITPIANDRAGIAFYPSRDLPLKPKAADYLAELRQILRWAADLPPDEIRRIWLNTGDLPFYKLEQEQRGVRLALEEERVTL